jgi:hypothetical protein
MKTMTAKYPWDWCEHLSPTWEEIAGKAHLYKTAYRRSDGKCLALLGVSRFADGLELAEPVFMVRDEFGLVRMTTDQLCGFCL